MQRSEPHLDWRRASYFALCGLLGGLLAAGLDFGAGWLFLPSVSDQATFAVQLALLLPPLGCLLTTVVSVPLGLVHSFRFRAVALVTLLAPWHAYLSIALFSGGKMSAIALKPAWQAAVFLALSAGATIGLWTVMHNWPRAARRPRLVAAILFLCAFLLSKVDQHAFANLYEFLHGELTLLVVVLGALGAGLLIEHRVQALTQREARLCSLAIFCLSAAAFTIGIYTQTHNQNVYVAMLAPRSPNAHSALLAVRTIFPPQQNRAAGRKLEGPARATSPDAPAPQANILLVTIDALRPDHLGTYGYGRQTSPHIDRFASEAALFERAYAQAPHSSYSISSMMTSHYIHQLVDLELKLPEQTLAKALREQGYHTAAFFTEGIFHTEGVRLASYNESAFGFARFAHSAAPAAEMTEMALTEIRRANQEKREPMLIWVHYFDVHEPYRATEFGTRDLDRYDSEIKTVDRAFGTLLRETRSTGSRPWVVALTADHGEEFRDHGGLYHGSTLFDEQIRVPLIIDIPDAPPRRISHPVELIDLTPTILSAVGTPIPSSMRGDDLRRLVTSEAEDWGVPVFGAVIHKRMVVQWPHKLVADLRYGTRELYNLAQDPHEDNNLASTDSKTVGALMPAIYGWLDSLQQTADGAQEPTEHQRALNLGRLGDRRAVEPLCKLLEDTSAEQDDRLEAAKLLTQLSDHNSKQALLNAMRGDDERVAAEAAVALGRMFDPRAQNALRQLMNTSDPMLRARAAVSLARLRDPAAVPGLVDALYTHPSHYERDEAIRWLGRLEDPVALEPLLSLLGDSQARHLVLYALGHLGDSRALPALIETLQRETNAFRKNRAIRALGQLGEPEAIEALVPYLPEGVEMTNMSESLVRLGAIERGQLGGLDIGPRTRKLLRPAPRPVDCHERAEKHDWDYRNRTWCALRKPTVIRLRPPKSGEAHEIRFRARSVDTPNTHLSVKTSDGESQFALSQTWQEYVLRAPSVKPMLITLTAEDAVGLDHVLVLPKSASRKDLD